MAPYSLPMCPCAFVSLFVVISATGSQVSTGSDRWVKPPTRGIPPQRSLLRFTAGVTRPFPLLPAPQAPLVPSSDRHSVFTVPRRKAEPGSYTLQNKRYLRSRLRQGRAAPVRLSWSNTKRRACGCSERFCLPLLGFASPLQNTLTVAAASLTHGRKRRWISAGPGRDKTAVFPVVTPDQQPVTVPPMGNGRRPIVFGQSSCGLRNKDAAFCLPSECARGEDVSAGGARVSPRPSFHKSACYELLSLEEQQRANDKGRCDVHQTRASTSGAGYSGETNPLLDAPLPPVSDEQFPVNSCFLTPPPVSSGDVSKAGATGDNRGHGYSQTQIPDRNRFAAPLSVYDYVDAPLPPANLAAPPDVYVLDFDHVIYMNVRELSHSAARAWRIIENSAEQFQRGRLSVEGMKREEAAANGCTKARRGNSESGSRASSVAVSSDRKLDALFASVPLGSHFPFWLLERARDIRRALPLRGVPDFMVALRQVLEIIKESGFKRKETLDAYVDGCQKAFDSEWKRMGDVDKMWFLTREGDMDDVQDVFAFRRGTGGGFPWGARALLGWDKNKARRRNALYERYGVRPEELQEAFDAARAEWRARSAVEWEEHVKYRTYTGHVASNNTDRLEVYEGFNPAAICCINNHINNWRRPVHVISSWERSEDVSEMLQLMGVSVDHEDAARLLCVYGREEMQSAALSELRRSPREVATWDPIVWPKVALVKSILTQAQGASDLRRPAHVVDGDIRTLLALRKDSRAAAARLYFCDWGHSSIQDKVQAFVAGRIKYMKETVQLVKIMGTPADIPARKWTHGFTNCPAEWLENYKMLRWLRWAGLEREGQTIVQDFTMPGRTPH
ncbi:transmembrane protein [Cystoisospora suis]|uniref:Transmembrane protein n=1 Tax=Cystoisospora suis TaxID=483139 RepID=A0A2C6K4R7_9APIC|nr:transmembrane protein [Cystoisospora suis]